MANNTVRMEIDVDPEFLFKIRFWKRVGIGIVIAVLLLLAGCPPYKMWVRQMEGEGERLHAEQVRQKLVIQAQAELEASKKQAEAIEILGEKAKKYPEWGQQSLIFAFGEALRSGKISQIIYVPTEANIPITEVARLRRQDTPKTE